MGDGNLSCQHDVLLKYSCVSILLRYMLLARYWGMRDDHDLNRISTLSSQNIHAALRRKVCDASVVDELFERITILGIPIVDEILTGSKEPPFLHRRVASHLPHRPQHDQMNVSCLSPTGSYACVSGSASARCLPWPSFVQGRIMEMAKDTQLRGLAEAALEFGEARELCQHEHGVPQRDGFLVTGNA